MSLGREGRWREEEWMEVVGKNECRDEKLNGKIRRVKVDQEK